MKKSSTDSPMLFAMVQSPLTKQFRTATRTFAQTLSFNTRTKFSSLTYAAPLKMVTKPVEEAVSHKDVKYEHLKTHFEALSKVCDVYGFAVGALGAWHPGNERVLSALGMTSRCKNLFRKLCCSDVIQGSTDIYRQHLGCDKVYT